MSEADFDVVRAIERDHLRTVAAETRAREEALSAHIANLQDQLQTAEKISEYSAVDAGALEFKCARSCHDCDGRPYLLTPHLEPINVGANFSGTRFEYGSPAQIIPQESSHVNMPDDDPLEVLGRLVEAKLGRQVDFSCVEDSPVSCAIRSSAYMSTLAYVHTLPVCRSTSTN
jgi:hypothetical protein